MSGWILQGIPPMKPAGPSKRSRSSARRHVPGRVPLGTPLEQALEKLGIRHFDIDILEQMSMQEIREHFGRHPGTPDEDDDKTSASRRRRKKKKKSKRKPHSIRIGLLIRNVIWQLHEQIQAGAQPEFYRKRGTIRGLWYHMKTHFHRHKLLRIDMYGSLIKQMTTMVVAGVVSYRDFAFTDIDAHKWHLPLVNTNAIIVCEKDGFANYAREYRDTYGCGAVTMGGSPSLMSVDYYTQRMREAGIDLTQQFVIITVVDYDPKGEDAANDFVEKLKLFGVRKFQRFRQYEGKYDRLDLIQPKFLNVTGQASDGQPYKLPASEVKAKYGKAWFARTGGVDGKVGWGIESDACRGERIHELLMEHLVPQLQVGVDAVRRRNRMRGLMRALSNVLVYKQTGVVPDDEIVKPRPRPPRPR